MPSVMPAEKLAMFVECLKNPIVVSHSHRSTRKPALCFSYELKVNEPSTYHFTSTHDFTSAGDETFANKLPSSANRRNAQYIQQDVTFQFGTKRNFIVDTGSTESIISTEVP
ncbi:unnamed protein product [Echinostoma caproni]|uniref:Peptidase A2 domain-containing protein n=1 Tax=Echinostoma caproni TaxID=27848 RepID=A0A183ALB8_9TREM|nr:unnamed protein product [Echinostoma caproni]